MASYSPFHTLLQLVVFAIPSNSCCWCSSLEMFTGLSPALPRASHTPKKWNLQPPPAQELNFNRTKQSNGRRRPDMERWEGTQPKVTSVSGGQAKPGCAGCSLWSPSWSALVPWCHLPRELTLTRPALPKQNLHKSPDFLPIPCILWCRCLFAQTDKLGYLNNPTDYFFTLILGEPALSNLGPGCH